MTLHSSQTIQQLGEAPLMALIRGDTLALRLAGFCDEKTSHALARTSRTRSLRERPAYWTAGDGLL